MEVLVKNENAYRSTRQLPSHSTVERLKDRPLPPPKPGQQPPSLPVPLQQQPISGMARGKPLPGFPSNQRGKQFERPIRVKSQPGKESTGVNNVKKRKKQRGLPRKSAGYNGESKEAGPNLPRAPANSNSRSNNPNFQRVEFQKNLSKRMPSALNPQHSNVNSGQLTAQTRDSLESTSRKTFKLDENYKQICRCGAKLVWTRAEDCYPKTKEAIGAACRPVAKPGVTSRVVCCDICKKAMRKTDFVYHCVKPSALHPTGFDVCGPCIIARPEKKQIVREQLKDNPDLYHCRTRRQLLELALRQDTLEVDIVGIVMKRLPGSGRFGTKKCYYTVKVDTGAYTWMIPYRYSEFLALHEHMQKMEKCVCIGFGRKLPKFPNQSLINLGETEKKKNKQMTVFRAYLEGLLRNKDTRDDPYISLFLCKDPDIVVRKNTIDDNLETPGGESTKGMVYHAYQKQLNTEFLSKDLVLKKAKLVKEGS